MIFKILPLIVICAIVLNAGCSKKDEWKGFVFPDKQSSLVRYPAGAFDTFEGCQNASMAMLESYEALEKGFYECRKNCGEHADDSLYRRSCEDVYRGNVYR